MSDIYAAVEQSMVDKVINDARYPVVILDQSWPFNPSVVNTLAHVIGSDEVAKLIKEAEGKDCSASPGDLACRAQQAQVERRLRIETVRELKKQAGASWAGPSDADLDRLADRSSPIQAHLAHLKVAVRSAPSIQISGTATSVKGVRVAVDATGELWVEYPKWICTKMCSIGPVKFCCGGHFELDWAKVATVTVNDVHIGIDATITLIVDHLAVFAQPHVDRLVLDYDILRDINLAGFANDALKNQQLQVIDAGKIVAALPYINTKYGVKSLALSGNKEIRIDITAQLLS